MSNRSNNLSKNHMLQSMWCRGGDLHPNKMEISPAVPFILTPKVNAFFLLCNFCKFTFQDLTLG